MKFNFKKKKKVVNEDEFDYKEEVNDELKNNSIVLSFAISIIIVGVISVFYKNNANTLLIGIAISSFLLTLIQCFSNGNTMLNITPIFTLLLFGFFDQSIEKIPGFNLLLKEQYSNLIIFVAFSFTFLTQAYKNILFKHKIRETNIEYNEEKNKMINTELDIIKNIKDRVVKIKRIMQEKDVHNASLDKAIKELIDYVEDESFVSHVKSTLITKGSEDKKVTFNIEEVEESIMLNSGIVRNREINANNHLDEML